MIQSTTRQTLGVLTGHWWAIGLRGLLGILVGVLALVLPVHTLIALVWLFGAYAFLDGVFNFAAAWRRTPQERPWWVLVLSGIAGMGAGVVSFFWPGITALVLVYLIAAWALITGGLQVAAAISLRKEIEGEWMLALSGMISLLLGGLLALFPNAGAIGLVWYFGIFAILFGAVMVAFSYRLRTWNQQGGQPGRRLAA